MHSERYIERVKHIFDARGLVRLGVNLAFCEQT